MSTKVSGGAAIKQTKRVFMRTGTANKGLAVNYNWDAVGVTAENDAFTTDYGRAFGTTVEKWCDARKLMVEAPDENNSLHFAGVVAAESHGIVGPNWISIHTPGSVCEIFASLSAGHATTGANRSYPGSPVLTSRNNGGLLTFNIATGTAIDAGEFKYSGYPGEGSALPLQVASSADVYIMAELMTGPPSGGVQCLALGTASDYSAGITITPSGVTFITSATLAASGVCSATISAGAYPGARKKIVFGAVSNLACQLSCAVPVRVAFTTGPTALAASTFVSCDTITFASAGSGVDVDYAELEWTGGRWLLLGSGGSVLIT